MGTCHLCPPDDNQVPDGQGMEHLRLMHPAEYGDGPDRWPDGETVTVDRTLDPTDFESED
jgi:hypothetical protein